MTVELSLICQPVAKKAELRARSSWGEDSAGRDGLNPEPEGATQTHILK